MDINSSIEIWKKEILETEKQFCNLVRQEGLAQAFWFYAAEEAVLLRENKIIRGRENIRKFFLDSLSEDRKEIRLEWEPSFVDVAASGELGYTFGTYNYSYTDVSGTRIETSGIFHSVWKHQVDGYWRYVWD